MRHESRSAGPCVKTRSELRERAGAQARLSGRDPDRIRCGPGGWDLRWRKVARDRRLQSLQYSVQPALLHPCARFDPGPVPAKDGRGEAGGDQRSPWASRGGALAVRCVATAGDPALFSRCLVPGLAEGAEPLALRPGPGRWSGEVLGGADRWPQFAFTALNRRSGRSHSGFSRHRPAALHGRHIRRPHRNRLDRWLWAQRTGVDVGRGGENQSPALILGYDRGGPRQ